MSETEAPPPKDYSEYSTKASIMLKEIQVDASLGRYALAAQKSLDLSHVMLEMSRVLRKMVK